MQDALERVAELPVKDAVDHGVHRTVEVAEPRERAEHQRRHAAAERRDQVDREERDPTEQEDAHDDAERDGRLVLRDPATTAAATQCSTRCQLLVGGGTVVDDQRRLGVVPGTLHDLGVTARVAVQSKVEERHGDARQVEADHGGHDCVDGTKIQHALLVVFVDFSCRRRRPPSLVYAVRERDLARGLAIVRGGVLVPQLPVCRRRRWL